MKTRKIIILLGVVSVVTMLLVACTSEQKKTEIKESITESSSMVESQEEKTAITINGHTYEYDVVTGATKEVEVDESKAPLDQKEKDAKMFWSGRPVVGEIVGDYYHNEIVFNEGYTAIVDVVTDNDKVALVEFDEIGPGDYYDGDWAGKNKRLSGYAFFQATKPRTDVTLVTIVNTMTYLESQMMNENRLDGEFSTIKGSSNSANEGFLPVASELADTIKTSSKQKYYGITKNLKDGLFARLIIIKEDDTITDVRYDEYFADTEDEIKDKELRKYYRQSKYYSKDYSSETAENFREDVDNLKKSVLEKQDLSAYDGDKAYSKNYDLFVTEMTKLIK
ncbi:hypothetical protein ACWOFR_16205 [Carnobacterium gallinarum]|uniref:hypothetical protein n=1 Tax=Carnobacterium gallinarum TaxID=2749 RepID=UPI000550DA2D|nr:hypothetical protein [Carnobacterium gallinarum]